MKDKGKDRGLEVLSSQTQKKVILNRPKLNPKIIKDLATTLMMAKSTICQEEIVIVMETIPEKVDNQLGHSDPKKVTV